ncbi:hypothetical protein [Shimia sp. Alg240-R146]|uniref:hypothetical protein n=1 Tax=Shimia sp. Alg240-R146 TaxID=2993449 RepID=UPI0022E027AB|nr:hypothetical protein [Shimia sp. Alg240-R146]
MIPAPTHFPNDSSHRVALFLKPAERDDFDRLEELTADGLQAARKAVEDLTNLQIQFDRTATANLTELQQAVEKRRLLNDRFVDAANALRTQLAGMEHPEDCAEVFDRIAQELGQAIALSNRVRDLLSAERDVGWHRGIHD